ncbi:MAG: general secretion pathway protein GspE [Archangium gephyra]|uniref:General secretion pathway protein GspE n=1 Tax=Archangium gephyra TaxID=48 RepID=A0A2W5TME7_9BACT|nr:MAG: general secretion pathway protein GspE [Archangium gephyra]
MALRPNVAKLRDLLLKAKVVDEFQMRAAMGRLEQWGGRLTGVIVDMGFTDDETMVQTLSQALRLPVAHLGMVPKDSALLAKVDPAFCDEHAIFPVSLKDRVATIAVSDPTELDTIDRLQSKLGARVQMVIAPESEIRAAIARHYRNEVVPAARKNNNRARDAHIEATKGQLFELDDRAPPKPGEASADAGPSEAWMKKAPSANTMLDDFLEDEGPTNEGLNAEELKRLEAARENQLKANAILRALQTLLTEKGYLR